MTIKSSPHGMELRLAQDVPFDVLTEALRTKFREASRFFRGAKMAVNFTGRVLNRTEEKAILEIISDEAGIDVVCIIDRDENNEMMYRSVVEQTLFNIKKREGQFYRGTLARREVLESDASIVILGDVEPGSRVIAKGNIVIVGALYGSVHAGASGDTDAFIAALSMQPRQLRIGDVEAKRQIICQESLNIQGPKIAIVDGRHIYLDPLVD